MGEEDKNVDVISTDGFKDTGAFRDGESPESNAIKAAAQTTTDAGKVETDVEDIFADGTKNDLPVFDVEEKDFYSNMTSNRRRMRFKAGTPVSKYMQQTKYKRPFWLRYKNDQGEFVRRVK